MAFRGFYSCGTKCEDRKELYYASRRCVWLYKKNETGGANSVIVGDNCSFGQGAKVLGAVRIGNNVNVGANAVVTHDIPDNAVVGGVPARVIKIKD